MPTDLHRRSLRLRDYDYSQAGAYFITLVTQGRECLFGEITNGQLELGEFGLIVAQEWARTADIRPSVELDEFVVMPNHLHAIVVLEEAVPDVGAHSRAPLRPGLSRRPRSLGSLVAGFKSAATVRINELRQSPGAPVWQRNYYDHVIRDDKELDTIRRYIVSNPAMWAEDEENPVALHALSARAGTPSRTGR